jgi:hypothetical protein
MIFISKYFFAFIYTIMLIFSARKGEELRAGRRNMKDLMTRYTGFGAYSLENTLFLKEMARKQEKLEEKRHKERLELIFPLLHGNLFMRDFYSGRY